jgi:hypothetical protein
MGSPPTVSRPLLLLEFNELCPALMRQFMDQGRLPYFQRLHDRSEVFLTEAQEDPPHLEPWIQWVTVHTGLPYSEHGVFHLGDGAHMAHPGIARILSDAGFRVGVCCSMNMNYHRPRGYLIPDPWNGRAEAYPTSLQPFLDTVSRLVQESSQDSLGSRREQLRFAYFLLRHGISRRTVSKILRQLCSERRDPGVRWRRAVILDSIQYDLFRHLNRRHQVDFATLFLNSTAHFQHYYWRNMCPDEFAIPPDHSDHPSLADAIPYGYQQMDEIVGRCLADFPQAVIVLCTALSQQPWRETTKCTYRPRQFEQLLRIAGMETLDVRVEPVMAEEFHLRFPSTEQAAAGAERLLALQLECQPLMRVEQRGADLFAACAIQSATSMDAPITRRPLPSGSTTTDEGPISENKFGELFSMVHAMRSGKHHPDGMLWIGNDHHRVHEERVPLTAVAPTILHHFGLTPPAHMTGASLAGPLQQALVATIP